MGKPFGITRCFGAWTDAGQSFAKDVPGDRSQLYPCKPIASFSLRALACRPTCLDALLCLKFNIWENQRSVNQNGK